MKKSILKITVAAALLFGFQGYAQSNIQTFTPSKLLNKGQLDFKFFNGLYTETKKTDEGTNVGSVPRSNFFTSTIEFFTGVSDSNRLNVGVILESRSNTFNGRSATSVFEFNGRTGLSTIAPAIKWQPLASVSNFSVQTAIHIPTHSEESNDEGFLDQTAWAFQNRLFFDYTLPGNKFQVFTELNTEYSFGEEESFANNSLLVSPGLFFSYFPSDKSTILVFSQHLQRIGLDEDAFSQNGTSLGFGGKYQLTNTLNVEVLYNKFVRGENFQGLGATYSLGLRLLL